MWMEIVHSKTGEQLLTTHSKISASNRWDLLYCFQKPNALKVLYIIMEGCQGPDQSDWSQTHVYMLMRDLHFYSEITSELSWRITFFFLQMKTFLVPCNCALLWLRYFSLYISNWNIRYRHRCEWHSLDQAQIHHSLLMSENGLYSASLIVLGLCFWFLKWQDFIKQT